MWFSWYDECTLQLSALEVELLARLLYCSWHWCALLDDRHGLTAVSVMDICRPAIGCSRHPPPSFESLLFLGGSFHIVIFLSHDINNTAEQPQHFYTAFVSERYVPGLSVMICCYSIRWVSCGQSSLSETPLKFIDVFDIFSSFNIKYILA